PPPSPPLFPYTTLFRSIEFDGYTTDEKVAIARGFLWPRQLKRNGLQDDEVAIDDDALNAVVGEYTREAGVRHLERELGKLLRKTDRQSTRLNSSHDQIS